MVVFRGMKYCPIDPDSVHSLREQNFPTQFSIIMDYKKKIKILEERIHRLSEIGIALSTERNSNKLFEMILKQARNITNADGRTLYSKNEEGNLQP